MRPVTNSQYKKLCVALIVLMHEYVLLLAFIQKQKGPEVHKGGVLQWSLSWLKQFIRSDKHSFSIFAFLLSFLSFFLSRSSFARHLSLRAASFSFCLGVLQTEKSLVSKIIFSPLNLHLKKNNNIFSIFLTVLVHSSRCVAHAGAQAKVLQVFYLHQLDGSLSHQFDQELN